MARTKDKYVSIFKICNDLKLIGLTTSDMKAFVRMIEPVLLAKLKQAHDRQESLGKNTIDSDYFTEIIDFFAKQAKLLKDDTLFKLSSIAQDMGDSNHQNLFLTEIDKRGLNENSAKRATKISDR